MNSNFCCNCHCSCADNCDAFSSSQRYSLNTDQIPNENPQRSNEYRYVTINQPYPVLLNTLFPIQQYFVPMTYCTTLPSTMYNVPLNDSCPNNLETNDRTLTSLANNMQKEHIIGQERNSVSHDANSIQLIQLNNSSYNNNNENMNNTDINPFNNTNIDKNSNDNKPLQLNPIKMETSNIQMETLETSSTSALVITEETKTIDNEKPYQCPYEGCGKYFKHLRNLKIHYKIHFPDDNSFICCYCDKIFARKDHLKEHFRVHTNERPFACVYCQKAFKQKHSLKEHIRNIHPELRT